MVSTLSPLAVRDDGNDLDRDLDTLRRSLHSASLEQELAQARTALRERTRELAVVRREPGRLERLHHRGADALFDRHGALGEAQQVDDARARRRRWQCDDPHATFGEIRRMDRRQGRARTAPRLDLARL